MCVHVHLSIYIYIYIGILDIAKEERTTTYLSVTQP